MLGELATVGRENQSVDKPRLKDGLSAIQQTLAIAGVLIGLVAYVLTIRADVNACKDSLVLVRAENVVLRAEAATRDERIRQLEIKVAKMEK